MKKNLILIHKETILCFLMILIQFLSLGMGNSYVEDKSERETLNLESNQWNELTSHSSPYYFKVNDSTPLMSESVLDGVSSMAPSSASDSDYEALSIYLSKHAIVPNENLDIKFYLTNNLLPGVGEIIHVSIYSGYYRNWNYYYENYYDVSSPVSSFTVQTNTKGEASYSYSNTANLGVYTIYAYSEEGFAAYQEFTIGEAGIFCKGPRYFMDNNDYTAAVQIVNLTDYSSLSNVDFKYSLSVYNYSANEWEDISSHTVQTNAYGYSLISADFTSISVQYYSIKLTVHTLDNSAKYTTFIYKSWDYYYYALWGGEQEANLDQYQFVVTTDKTIYNPGDTVSLRALVLKYSFMNETKTLQQNIPVQITLSNPDEMDIFWDTIITDHNGVLTYQIPFDEDCDLGLYGITFKIENIEYRYDIKVQYYTKPVFRVEIDTNGRDFYPKSNFNLFGTNELFEGKIRVEYYFGQPVVDASVVMVIKDYTDTIITEIKGATNSMGIFDFSFNLAEYSELDYSFKVGIEVIDQYKREASTSKQFTRIEELYAYGYLTDWAPNPNEDLEYFFSVYQLILNDMAGDYYWSYDYNPLANLTVSIEVFGHTQFHSYLSDLGRGTIIGTYQATTNIYGSGKLQFQIPQAIMGLYNLFEVKLSVSLEDKRETESSTYFRFQKYSLDIEVSADQINPGDNLPLTLNYHDVITDEEVSGQGYIYVYDSSYQLLGKKFVDISGEETLNIYLSDYAPTGEYRIYSYVYSPSTDFFGGYNYHSVFLTFTVGQDYEIMLSTNGTVINEERQEIQVQIGDILSISGEIPIPSNLPVYLEIYKRGLLISHRLNLVEGSFTYELPITSTLGPDFTIMVYAISTTGVLYEAAIIAHIKYETSFVLSTDKDMYEPGETITLTVSPNGDQPTLVSLSFIDSSVLDVEPEDDSELAYFTQTSYYAYIGSGSSWGSGFDAESYWWIGYGSPTGGLYSPRMNYKGGDLEMAANEFAADDSAQKGGENAIEAPTFNDLLTNFDTEIRKNISESANWVPGIVITTATNFTFKLQDNIGEWTIRAVGNYLDQNTEGNMLWGDIQTIPIKTYLPFFIEFDISEPVYQDDILTVKGYIYNYLGETADTYIAIDAPGFAVLNNEVQHILIPADYVSEVEFSLYCENAYMHNITLLAATNVSGQGHSDAKLLNLYVQPNGLELLEFTKGMLNSSDESLQINYSIDSLSIYSKETLAIYTDIMDISIDSWESLIGYPYGCVEQTMSKLLPTTMVYTYLEENDLLSSIQQQEMGQMIFEGINRIYGFQHVDGGWGWWYDDDSRIQMTAIVLSALYEIDKSGFQINDIVLENALEFLLLNQKNDGTWAFEHHSSNLFESTSYITKALLTAAETSPATLIALQKADTILQALWNSSENQSPFGASLYYLGFINTTLEDTDFCDSLIEFLLLERESQDNTIYWGSPTEPGWYWRNLGNNVEITSYSVQALALDGYLDHFSIIQKAIEFLLNAKSQWGWRSTADTAAAISALTYLKTYAESNEIIEFEGNISLFINDELDPLFTIAIDKDSNELSNLLLTLPETASESNTINVELEGDGQISYVFAQRQIIRAQPTFKTNAEIIVKPNEEFDLKVNITDIHPIMPLKNLQVELEDIPDEIKLEGHEYNKSISTMASDGYISFTFKSPSTIGIIEIGQISIAATIIYNQTGPEAKSQQVIRKSIGPIRIEVSNTNIPQKSHFLGIPLAKIISFPDQVPRSSTSLISISKFISESDVFLPGDLINITINIENSDEIKQYYALSDSFPAGTSYVENSLQLLINDKHTEATLEVSRSGLDLFIAEVELGFSQITYQIQVEQVKNSYFGECRLWGMYDDVSISTAALILENIPIKYFSNDTLYRDTISPQIESFEYEQNREANDMIFSISVQATDENQIQKIRVLYSQGQGWRTYSRNIDNTEGVCDLVLRDLENMDSNLEFIIEVLDIYGNVISTSILDTELISSLIPYIVIGVIVGISIGLAYVASYLAKRHQSKQLPPSTANMTSNDAIQSGKEDEISFLDEDDEILNLPGDLIDDNNVEN